MYVAYLPPFAHLPTEFNDWFLSHSVDYHVGTGVAQNALLQPVLPIIVMCEATKRRFNATENHRHIGEKLLENLRIDNRGILRAAVVATVRTISILRTKTFSGSVFVHHRVHATRCYAKEKIRTAELLEVAEVAMPVGLRHNRHSVARRFKRAPDYSSTE